MSEEVDDPVRAALERFVGQPLGPPERQGEPTPAPEAVNGPMIRHWVDAFGDRNPVYEDEAFARTTRFGGLVAPPAMLQTWSMPRPRIEGIERRGGAPDEMEFDNPLQTLDEAGFTGALATNSELEFERYLRPGDQLASVNVVESISPKKTTGLGQGYFVTWITTYTDQNDEVVGRQLFRVFKFDPTTHPSLAGKA